MYMNLKRMDNNQNNYEKNEVGKLKNSNINSYCKLL